jgi:glc operon protein GlcG
MHSYLEIGQAEARVAIDVAAAELQARGKAAVIAVGDRHGELIALLRTDGALLSCVVIAINKAFTAARERTFSGDLGRAIRDSGADIAYLGDPRYVGWDGGAPIMLGDQVLGSVALSGLTAEEDRAIAEIAVSRVLEHLAASGLS